jgi:hypothetical protein
MTRASVQWLAAFLGIVSLALISRVPPFAWAKCATKATVCADNKCYVHDRYCTFWEEDMVGYWYAKNVVYDRLPAGTFPCTNKALPGGTPAAKEEVHWDAYDDCDPDCGLDFWSTGAPKGDIWVWGKETLNRECKS